MTEKKSFETKFSDFRKRIDSMDWSPDGLNVKQNYPYLSNQKMKGNISKALVENGLGWELRFVDLQPLPGVGERMSQHFILKAEAKIFDSEDFGRFVIWEAYGEGADTGDKAISKAQTNAFKNIIANNLLVSEFDAVGESIIDSNESAKMAGESLSYQDKKEMAKDLVLKMHPAEPVQTVKTVDGRSVTDTQMQVMTKIMDQVKSIDAEKLESFGTLDYIQKRFDESVTSETAAEFIKEFKGVMALQ